MRMAGGDASRPKQFTAMRGLPLYWHATLPFTRTARVRGLVFVFPEAFQTQAREEITALMAQDAPGLPWLCVTGGKTRQESVACGLAALPKDCDTVLVHDAARPFVTPLLINRVLDALAQGHSGVVPGLPLADTIKEVDAHNLVNATPDRERLRAVQTPQGFSLHHLRACHRLAQEQGITATDDAALLERYADPGQSSHAVLVVEGDPANRKITTPDDMALLHEGPVPGASSAMQYYPCVGFGYDVHRYGGSRPFVLGGVSIPTDITVEAHSDGDVLLHALADALLGAIGAGDIGLVFPDTDPAFDNANSGMLLAEVRRMAQKAGLRLTHADMTVVAQIPKVGPHRDQIAKNVAALLGLPVQRVNVKATTEEKLGFTGTKQGIKAYAVVTGMMPDTLEPLGD